MTQLAYNAIEQILRDKLSDILPEEEIPPIATKIYWRLRADGYILKDPQPAMEERGWGKPGHKLERSLK